MKTYQAPPVNKPTRKEIKFWQAQDKYGCAIENNNSIAILRAKYGASVIYKAIR